MRGSRSLFRGGVHCTLTDVEDRVVRVIGGAECIGYETNDACPKFKVQCFIKVPSGVVKPLKSELFTTPSVFLAEILNVYAVLESRPVTVCSDCLVVIDCTPVNPVFM